MLPTVDFCFAELMKNDKVRKGFIAALLGVSPEEVAGYNHASGSTLLRELAG